MKPFLTVCAILFAVSAGASAEPADKPQPTASRKKPPKQQVHAKEDKPKAEEGTTPGGLPHSFVIPSNTCEQGTPLQKLLTDKPRESK